MCTGEDRSATLPYGSSKSEGKVINCKVGSVETHLVGTFFEVILLPFHSLNSVIPLKIMNPGNRSKREENYMYKHICRCVIHTLETLEI